MIIRKLKDGVLAFPLGIMGKSCEIIIYFIFKASTQYDTIEK